MGSKQAKVVSKAKLCFFHKTDEKANGVLYFAVECIALKTITSCKCPTVLFFLLNS